MDNRYAERSVISERVELWNGKEKYGEFETKNHCSGGIFVENCRNKMGTFSARTLTVKFCYNPNLSYQASYAALIVHETNNGIGLKWSHK